MVRKAAQQLKESRALNFASIDEPVDVDGNDEESASLGLNLGSQATSDGSDESKKLEVQASNGKVSILEALG